jgi:hypothetical protein
MPELVKRTACYIQNPTVYGISCDICGGSNITWSEYEHMIWCFDCQKDTRGSGGIFDGPISAELSKMLGISFDKIEIPSGDILYQRRSNHKIYWNKIPPKGVSKSKWVK